MCFAIYRKYPHFQEKSHLWHNSGAVATITQPTKILLSRYTAGYISDDNSWWPFSEVKNWPKYYPLEQLCTLFCAFVDCNHHAMTALFEYSGSLAWGLIPRNSTELAEAVPTGKDSNPNTGFIATKPNSQNINSITFETLYIFGFKIVLNP